MTINHCTAQDPKRERLPDAATIKAAAAGRWLEILPAAGIPAELLDGKGHPCPRCGGTDRFAAFNDVAERGAVICRRCFSEGGGDGLATVAWIRGVDFPAALRWLGEYLRLDGPRPSVEGNGRRRIVATYDYRDEGGELLFQVVRFEPKDFRQRRPDPSKPGEWINNLKDVRRVLYRLPELLAADPARPVFICEGEGKVERLRALGLIATTAPQGAGKWKDEYAQPLRGRSVVILPDHDKPGQDHGQAVARSVATVAALVKILELPGLQEKGDVKNWLDAGGTAERLQELADAAPVWTPGDDPAPEHRPAIVRLCDVAPRALEWLWPGRFPLGKLSLICGDPGTGKSLLVADLAARVSAGLPWPDVTAAQHPAGDVWLISLEDDLGDTIRPRLDAAGADVLRVHALPDVFSLDGDLTRLDFALSGTRGARLLVIDPIAACLGKVDSHKNADVRGALAPLAALAARRGVAVVCIHHLNKSAVGPALYRAAGSLAFAAAARAVWLVATDRNDKGRRLFLPIKSNLSEALTGLAYRIEGDAARGVGRIVWDSQPIAMNADDALAILTADDAHGQTLLAEAKEWLLDVLKGERLTWDELITLAGKEHSKGTLRRARTDLQQAGQIIKEKHGGGLGAKTVWFLADDAFPLFAGLDDERDVDKPAPALVELATPRKPR